MNQNNQQPVEAAIWEAVTRLERQDSTYDERIAAAGCLRALAAHPAEPVEAVGAVQAYSEPDMKNYAMDDVEKALFLDGHRSGWRDAMKKMAVQPTSSKTAPPSGPFAAVASIALKDIEAELAPAVKILRGIDGAATHPAQPVEAAGAVQASEWPTPADLLAEHLDNIAEQWTECMYDAPGEFIDIGASLRSEFAKLNLVATHPADPVGGDVRDALQFIYDTFKRDLDAGYKTRDKEFAVAIAAKALRAPVGGALVAKAEQDKAHVMPPTRGTDSQQDPSERAFDALYGAVMNIPCKPDAGWGLIAVNHYKFGHRDARHAAADLIAEAASGFREGRNAQPESVGSSESAAAPAEPNLEQLLIEHRIGLTPEYEGGWHATVYGDDESSPVRGYGNTPGEAVKTALATMPIPTKGNGDTDTRAQS